MSGELRRLENVVICGGCRQLVDRTGRAVWPSCACHPITRQATDYEPGRAFLCKCCAAVVLEDAHRWTTFFCRHCAPHVAVLNRAVGWPVIACGKHSLVNGAFIRPDAHAPAKLSAALRRTAASVGVLDRWVDLRVRRVLQSMGRADGRDVAVVDYFARVQHSPAACRQAFAELCTHVGANIELDGS